MRSVGGGVPIASCQCPHLQTNVLISISSPGPAGETYSALPHFLHDINMMPFLGEGDSSRQSTSAMYLSWPRLAPAPAQVKCLNGATVFTPHRPIPGGRLAPKRTFRC
jgi:hypothetical protein